MFDVSLPWADFWYDAFNVLLFFGAFAVAVGTYGSIKMGAVKERFSDERISTNEKETARAIEETKKLEIVAQELRQKNLTFEAAISPRILLEQVETAVALSRFAGLPFVVVSPSDFEPKRTAGQIRFMLLQANWTRFTESSRFPFVFPDGVTLHVIGRISKQDDPARDAATALVSILNDNGIQSTVGHPMFFLDDHGNPIMPVPGPSPTERRNVLVVEVGQKPLPTSLQLKSSDIPANAGRVRIWGNIAE